MLLFQFDLNLNLNYDKQYFSESRKYSWKIINMCIFFSFLMLLVFILFFIFILKEKNKLSH